MKTAKYIALLGFIIMAVSIIYGFMYSNFSADGSQILALTWGKITLIDIYFMFFIFSGWIYYREQNLLKFLGWFLLMLVFGAATACLYLYIAFNRSKGDWERFWKGKNI